jgi:hypothetical protein
LNTQNVINLPGRGKRSTPAHEHTNAHAEAAETVSASFLYAGVDENGELKFDIVSADREHVRSLLLAIQVMTIRLVEMIDAG